MKPRNSYISGGLYTPVQAGLTLAIASSLDGGKKEREGELEREREKGEERESMMVKDDLTAKGKETEWRGRISTYRGSEIDPGVLKLSQPDSWGTILQVCSPTWTNKDIRDIDTVHQWTQSLHPPSVHLHLHAERRSRL